MTIHLHTEALPWLGNSHSEVLEELHFHDLPLVVLATHEDQRFLSRCVVGEVEDVNLWTYTPLTEADLTALDEMDESSFDEVIDEIAHRSTHVAIALNGYGIVAWTEWSDFPGDPRRAVGVLAERMTAFLAGAASSSKSATVQAERLLTTA